MASQQSFHGQVAKLNDSLSEFNDFVGEYEREGFRELHFLGSFDPHQAEEALVEHWDDFLEHSRAVLNDEDIPREDALGHVDAVNLQFKRTMTAAQSQRN